MNLEDMDLEAIEHEFKKVKKDKKKKEKRSRSRSKKTKHRRSRSKSKQSRSKSKKIKNHKSSRSRSRSSKKTTLTNQQSRKIDEDLDEHHPLQKKTITEEEGEERKRRELEEWKKKLLAQQEEMEQIQREEQTVQVSCIPNKAKETDIYKYFQHYNVGKIRDIKLIKDHHTGKSKGVAYVEFWQPESVVQAMQISNKPFVLNGKVIDYALIQIRHSQAQVNWAAAQQKALKEQKLKEMQTHLNNLQNGPARVMVGNLKGKNENITEIELENLFKSIGKIDQIDLPKDVQSKKNKGYAYIQYHQATDAKKAVEKLNGFKLNDQILRVKQVESEYKMEPSDRLDWETDDISTHKPIVKLDNKAKMDLMGKLMQRGKNGSVSAINHEQNAINSGSSVKLDKGIIPSKVPTQYILMANMFTGKEVQLDPIFFHDLQEEVEEESRKQGSVQSVIIDRKSQSGNVWIQYNDVQSAMKCQNQNNSRMYNDRKIFCCFVTDYIYNQFTKNIQK